MSGKLMGGGGGSFRQCEELTDFCACPIPFGDSYCGAMLMGFMSNDCKLAYLQRVVQGAPPC